MSLPTVLTRGYNRNHNVTFRDETYNATKGSSLWELAPTLAALCDPSEYQIFEDHFANGVNTVSSTGKWVLTKDGTVVASQLDRAGGWCQIITDVNDNDEAYLASLGESWLFAASKPLWFEAKVELTEANTDDANILVGLIDASGANTLLDNGGGPAASYSGAVWFKVDGGTVWQFETSNAGTQVTNTSAGTFTSGTAYKLGFIFDPANGTTGSITPYLNGTAGTAHAITLASLTEMNIVLGVKAGGANAETLKFDYVKCIQVL
jgi:hypothetical protein